MSGSANWDWDTKEKNIADINDWKNKYASVQDIVASDDGEKIACKVKNEEKKYTTCVGTITETRTSELLEDLKAYMAEMGMVTPFTAKRATGS